MNKKITEINLIKDTDNIFTERDVQYIIPIYQRGYEWKDEQINQFIDDINDFEAENYYLGSVIVNKTEKNYEVIDGQQRLITLFLLFSYLKLKINAEILTFECREKYNDTLNKIQNNDVEKNCLEIDYNLISGYEIIVDKFKKIDKTIFIEKLKKVIFYRIEVPKNTDLNKYFEIMNTRGEQLEQQDVLKERFISAKGLTENERDLYSKIWEACSDMNNYVQMGFDVQIRKKLFGKRWNELDLEKIDSILQEQSEEKSNNEISLEDLLDGKEKIKSDIKEETIENKDGKYKSIITFPYFLLHVLKVYTHNADEVSFKPMDDKDLLKTFQEAKQELFEKQLILDDKQFTKEFIRCLLKCRFLFDKYFIKRYSNIDETSDDGEWSLKELKKRKEADHFMS